MREREDGAMITEPTETLADDNGAAPPSANGERIRYAHEYRDGDQSPHAGWNLWLRDNLQFERQHIFEVVGSFFDEFRAEIDESSAKIEELEMKVATLSGAIDILRREGAPDGFDVLRQEILDSVNDALGMARADFEDKLAVQAKRISELELKLAEAAGAINVLRGKGAPGSFNVRGTFAPGTVYSHLDVVAFNGSSWVATRDSPGDLPGPGWQLLSSVGKRGRRGERGERGPVGEPGLSGAGAAGFASWRLDCVRYTATPMMSDGSLGPPLELRSLFAQFLAEVNGS